MAPRRAAAPRRPVRADHRDRPCFPGSSPLLAAVAPPLHLLLRMVRDEDPRAGRPFRTGVALRVAASRLDVLVDVAAYATAVPGS